MADPRVSVLITAYEHEHYIARALEGALEQRGVAFEVLVGDEASTDRERLGERRRLVLWLLLKLPVARHLRAA